LLKKDADISNYYVIYYNKKIAGFCSFYNHLQYNNKIMSNLKFALKFIKKRNIKYVHNNLKKFNNQFPRYKLLKNYVYLSRILVFKSFQNKGIGKYVMHKIFKNKKLILHVISSNNKAIKFYKKLGSKVINNHHKYFLLKISF
jgi:ribosomal protein S18 acetylase RimI-like enzyme